MLRRKIITKLEIQAIKIESWKKLKLSLYSKIVIYNQVFKPVRLYDIHLRKWYEDCTELLEQSDDYHSGCSMLRKK